MWKVRLTARRLAARVQCQRLAVRIECVEYISSPSSTLIESPVDFVFLSDGVSWALDRQLDLEDTFTLDDSVSVDPTIVVDLEDSVELSDTPETAADVLLWLSSSTSATDAYSLLTDGGVLQETLIDGVNVTDGIEASVTLDLQESVSAVDTLLADISRVVSLSDSLDVSDAAALSLTLSASDSVSPSDAINKFLVLTLQGSSLGYVDPGYFASDYVESASQGDFVTVSDSII